MDLGVALRTARRRAGLTQREVAAGAGTSQTAVAAYEGGRKSPNLTTLARLAGAMGTTLSIGLVLPTADEHVPRRAELLSRHERQSLWLHRAIAVKIQADPAHALAVAADNLSIRRRADARGQAESWRRAWEALLAGPIDPVLAVLCSTSTYAGQLRQTAPFAGLLTPRERWAVYRSFTNAEGPSSHGHGPPRPERPPERDKR